MSEPLHITDEVIIPAQELSWKAVRSSGPGGQNVNKVASKIELRYDLAASDALPAGAKARLQSIARSRLDARGRLLITSQRTRDQQRNLTDARERLATLIRRALLPPKPRRPTRPSAAARRRRVEQKRRQSEKKRERQRPTD